MEDEGGSSIRFSISIAIWDTYFGVGEIWAFGKSPLQKGLYIISHGVLGFKHSDGQRIVGREYDSGGSPFRDLISVNEE